MLSSPLEETVKEISQNTGCRCYQALCTPCSSPSKAGKPKTEGTKLCLKAGPAQRRLLAKGWDMAPKPKATDPLPAHDSCTTPTKHI